MIVSLGQPIWLVLLIPVLAMWWFWPAPTRFLQWWRGGLLCVVLLGMCWPMLKLPSRHGTVMVVADRSLSMPADADDRLLEQLKLVAAGMTQEDRLGVVTFGQDLAVERAPDLGPVQPFVQEVMRDGSSLGQAMGRALSLLPPQGPARMLVLSDGRWTGSDPAAAMAAAAARNVAVDYRYLGRARTSDLAVQLLDAPRSASPGESFLISGWVRTTGPTAVRYELRRNQAIISQGSRDMPAGVTRLMFRDIAPKQGAQSYSLHVTSDAADPVPENNTARALVNIDAASTILVISDAPGQGLVKLLTAAGLQVTHRLPGDVIWSLDTLASHHGVILENIPANTMTEADMQTLASWVQQTGSGLMMTGGKRSFGPGGYFKSPLDPILPVSMEIRQEHRKFSIAIVVALDRSGSMSMPVGEGRTKMDLANLGTSQVVDMLSPMDEIGVFAVDTSPHEIVPLTAVTDPQAIKNKVLRIESMGGGIFVYQALSAAAGMVSKSRPMTRHIILFADAMDSEEPGNYKSLLDQCQAAGITVSVIGLGTDKDVDAPLLQDVARRGNGRIYFTQDAQELPRLFAQDTFVVARSSFVEDQTPVEMTGGMVSLAGRTFGQAPAAGGYNLCYLRDGANLAGVTRDEYNAPLVAAWQAGAGRVAAYTGEVDGQFTGPIAQWPQYGQMLASLARWTTGRNIPLPANMMLRQVVTQGRYRIELLLDPQRAQMDLASLPAVSVLSGKVGQPPQSQQLTMKWVSPDTLAVDVPMRSDETALATVDLGSDLGVHNLPAVCLPYSPEFEPVESDHGQATLARIARVTGGQDRVDLQGIWGDLSRQPRWVPVAHWVLILAMLMLLLEVFERRSGMMTGAIEAIAGRQGWLRRAVPKEKATEADDAGKHSQPLFPWLARRRVKSAAPTGRKGKDGPGDQAPPLQREPATGASPASDVPAMDAPQPSMGSIADAMRKARSRAGQRLRPEDDQKEK